MCHNTSGSADKQLNNLIEFRQAAYGRLDRAKDALFELSDALQLTPKHPPCASLFVAPYPS